MPLPPRTPRWLSAAALLCAFPLAGCSGSDPAQPTGDVARGAALYKEMCASCHGGAGEMLCVGCHRVGGPGGNPHAPGFSSQMRPAVDRPCVLCHGGAL